MKIGVENLQSLDGLPCTCCAERIQGHGYRVTIGDRTPMIFCIDCYGEIFSPELPVD